MAVPDFQTLMYPVLYILSDSQTHTAREIIERLADEFDLSQEERREMLPSGRQARFDNRVHWASAHLRKAGLAESLSRGSYRITELGLQVIHSGVDRIDLRYLAQFPGYIEFRSRSQLSDTPDEIETDQQTPEELLEASYQSVRRTLAAELIERLLNSPPRFFEQFVIDLLVAMGYGGSRKDAGQAVGQSGDDGIDGIIKEDRLGLDVIYVQAKRWQASVGGPIVRDFIGSLELRGANKGILITTSQFTDDAKRYVDRIQQKKIVLVDGETLAQYMIDFGVGVSEKAVYVVKRIDEDYFSEK